MNMLEKKLNKWKDLQRNRIHKIKAEILELKVIIIKILKSQWNGKTCRTEPKKQIFILSESQKKNK